MDTVLSRRLAYIFAGCVGVDQATKAAVRALDGPRSLGPLLIESHLNPGLILGAMTQSSPLARVVFVSSVYGFLLFAFFFLQTTLSNPLVSLRTGMTIFFAAITSNVIDRVVHGAVMDFICVLSSGSNFHFNLADVAMWAGAGMTVFALIRSEALIWHPDTKRKRLLVDRGYQFKWAFQTALVALCASLILIVFSYTYFAGAGAASSGTYLLCTTILCALFSVMTFFSALMLSHRSAGPLFAFEKYVDSLLRGEDAVFFLRKNDEHQNLLGLAEKLKEKFNEANQK